MNEQTIPITTSKRLAAEFLGTAFLLPWSSAPHHGAKSFGRKYRHRLTRQHHRHWRRLDCLNLMFGEVSGAHFNPAVSMMAALQKEISAQLFVLYVIAQIAGAFADMSRRTPPCSTLPSFLPLPMYARALRNGGGIYRDLWPHRSHHQYFAHSPRHHTPFAVAAYITAAYWFHLFYFICQPSSEFGTRCK